MEIILNGKKMEILAGSTVSDALTVAKINPETVLVKRNKTLIPHDELLGDGDSLELINVISGG
ncbi:MAG TPA: sulfur carrier protein ThiS [archaeon]|nr:sulfur carrier protein ThiS [archaeon]